MPHLYHRGQVTIPKEARERLGLSPGDELTIRVRDDEIVIRRVKSLFELRLPHPGNTDMSWPEMRAAAHEELLEHRSKLHR